MNVELLNLEYFEKRSFRAARTFKYNYFSTQKIITNILRATNSLKSQYYIFWALLPAPGFGPYGFYKSLIGHLYDRLMKLYVW